MFTILLYLVVGSLATLLTGAAFVRTWRLAVNIGESLVGSLRWWRARCGALVKAKGGRAAAKVGQALPLEAPPIQMGPDPIVSISRNMGNGREATVILRARPEKKLVTVQLIVWASKLGRTRRSKPKRIETSSVELGALPACRITEDEVREAMRMAETILQGPAFPGTRAPVAVAPVIEVQQIAEVTEVRVATPLDPPPVDAD